jgi:hypothetical protein
VREIWAFIFSEEQRLRVFENRMLKAIFVSRRGGVIRAQIKLHEEELHNFYASHNILGRLHQKRWC